MELKEVVIRQNDNCVIKIPVNEYMKGGEQNVKIIISIVLFINTNLS